MQARKGTSGLPTSLLCEAQHLEGHPAPHAVRHDYIGYGGLSLSRHPSIPLSRRPFILLPLHGDPRLPACHLSLLLLPCAPPLLQPAGQNAKRGGGELAGAAAWGLTLSCGAAGRLHSQQLAGMGPAPRLQNKSSSSSSSSVFLCGSTT